MLKLSLNKIDLRNQVLDGSQGGTNYALNFFKKIFFLFGLLLVLGACSLVASVTSLAQLADIENLNRKDPDFIHGEVVTSGRYQITGVFGEVSEKTKAINSNEWEFEGVFYE